MPRRKTMKFQKKIVKIMIVSISILMGLLVVSSYAVNETSGTKQTTKQNTTTRNHQSNDEDSG